MTVIVDHIRPNKIFCNFFLLFRSFKISFKNGKINYLKFFQGNEVKIRNLIVFCVIVIKTIFFLLFHYEKFVYRKLNFSCKCWNFKSQGDGVRVELETPNFYYVYLTSFTNFFLCIPPTFEKKSEIKMFYGPYGLKSRWYKFLAPTSLS